MFLVAQSIQMTGQVSVLRIQVNSRDNVWELSPHHLVALWFSLQLLMVVEGQSIQDGVLLVVHRRHGALAVDFVHVNFFLSFQHCVPPNLWRLAERQLQNKRIQENEPRGCRKGSSSTCACVNSRQYSGQARDSTGNFPCLSYEWILPPSAFSPQSHLSHTL